MSPPEEGIAASGPEQPVVEGTMAPPPPLTAPPPPPPSFVSPPFGEGMMGQQQQPPPPPLQMGGAMTSACTQILNEIQEGGKITETQLLRAVSAQHGGNECFIQPSS